MTRHTLLPLLITAWLAAHSSALSAEDSAKAKTTGRKSSGKSTGQTSASYMPKVKAALAKRWAEALAPRMAEFAHGSVNVTFKLDAGGKVTDFTVAANTSNEAFAKFCEEFVRATNFDKPPAGALTDGLLEIPFTFTIL
jgi:TonB family protein